MKKFLSIFLAIILIFSLAACGEKKEDEQPSIGMPNPVTEVESLEALNDELGVKLHSPGVMGVVDTAYQLIDCGDYKIADYKYSVNGYECSFRATPIYDQDISGYYAEEGTVFQNQDLTAEEVAYYFDETNKLARFATIDGQYVFNIKDDGAMEEETFKGLVSELMVLAQPAPTQEELAAKYQALDGEYYDLTSQRATATIYYPGGDNVEMCVMWSSSASEYTMWTMTMKFTEDGLLSYEDETCKNITVAEDLTETEDLVYENRSGFFAVDENGNLAWLGAASENCETCVFEKSIQ